jgi:hypothetical protein
MLGGQGAMIVVAHLNDMHARANTWYWILMIKDGV